jgi:hypothetical protein
MYNVLQLIKERGRKSFDKKLFVSDQYICSLTEIERTRFFASTFVHIFYWRNNCWRKIYIVFRKRTALLETSNYICCKCERQITSIRKSTCTTTNNKDWQNIPFVYMYMCIHLYIDCCWVIHVYLVFFIFLFLVKIVEL